MKQLTELTSKIHKQFMQLNTRAWLFTNNPIKKWGKDLNRHFSKEDIQMANKHMKDAQRCSLIEKCKSKLQRYHLTLVIMVIIKKSTNNKCWRGYEEKGTSCTVGRNVNWYSHYGREYDDSLKN